MVSKIADAIIEGRTETESAGDAAAYGDYAAPEAEEPVTTMAEAEAQA
jgi:hypothetical protein